MKYLAILKDSWREALDSKVLYFLLGLSALVILGVASISFRPKPADEGLSAILERFPGARINMGFMSQPGPIRYELENFQQLNSGPPWDGDYRFDIAVHEVPPPKEEGKEQPPPPENAFRTVVWLSSLQTEEEKLSPEDREARKRLLAMQEQAATLPPQEIRKFLNDKMREEVNSVTPAQMERFIRQQLAAHGTLDTTSVEYRPADKTDIRFAVGAKGRPETYRAWPHSVSYVFGAINPGGESPIGNNVFSIEGGLIGTYGAGIAMLLASVVTAFFIPNMLHKGTIDLLLAKPVRRSALFVCKFLGGLIFMFVNTLMVVVGIWLVLGLRSGLWAPGFLLSIFILTFEFAIFYSVSALFGVLTRSPIVSILMASVTWVVLFLVGLGFAFAEATRKMELAPNWFYTTADVLHFVLPRYKDLDVLNSQLVGRELLGPESPERKAIDRAFGSIKWGETLALTTGFIAVMLALACLRFATKDY
jgi:ABC-type transport system involved in multi-copper enzyme maturation permease subunit